MNNFVIRGDGMPLGYVSPEIPTQERFGGDSVAHAARELGISPGRLCNWFKRNDCPRLLDGTLDVAEIRQWAAAKGLKGFTDV